jgi:uncharacterized protein
MTKSTLASILTVAGLFAATAAVAQPAPPERRTIRVEGHAVREVTPDMASISIGVTTRAPKAAAALSGNAADAQRIIDAAKKAGIEPRDITTSAVSLSENLRNRRDPASGSVSQEPDGFIASNTVTVRVRDLPKLGGLLTDMVGDGANRIQGLSFDYSERDRVLDELRVDAVRDARRTAARLAEAAGAAVGQVVTVAYPPRRGGPGPEFAMMRAAAPRANVPIEAGALSLSADVETVWTLQ